MSKPQSERRRRGRRAGVSTIEFALITPVLLMMLFGVVEAGRYMVLRLKINDLSAGVADLVARLEVAERARVIETMSIAPTVLRPFLAEGRVTIVVSAAARTTPAAEQRIVWRAPATPPVSRLGSIGSIAQIPENLAIPGGDAVIVAEVFYVYEAWLLDFIPSVTIYEAAYARPRRAPLTELIAP